MASIDFEDVAALVARALNGAQIPCVLWGHCLMILHGIPTIMAVGQDEVTRSLRLTHG